MPVTLPLAALNLGSALILGALIGSERQVRQRMAGLRTNALVSLGAAGFVTYAGLALVDTSPTRVAAQVVSGIGFLGAGIIFRDGFNVHGLNTAATLWCSAGVGILAGGGHIPYAALLTAMVVFVNLGLRPVVKWLKRTTRAGVPVTRQFRVTAECPAEKEADLRGLMVRNLSVHGLHLTEMQAEASDGGVILTALINGEGATDTAIEQAVGRLLLEPPVRHMHWQATDES